ncbi:MAG: NAD(P)-dependent dehydrogenase (short-subunit alcohol dehydrogenase family) [Cryomorphaceae bacterium]|jgi:NAD(P)-dependent dehydrogenase (short-subunit alcohol dehydrogenase family)
MIIEANKTILITGGNAGIGFATAKYLVRQGQTVIIACRNKEKANAAIKAIEAEVEDADISFRSLDLASLKNVRNFAQELLRDYQSIDVLINNAGAMPSSKILTEDGFEFQFGVNYLGHFLLTHLLLPALDKAGSPRIVHVSSIMHLIGKINPKSFKGGVKYSATKAYAQSKLANLMLSNELASRLPIKITSNAVHPGGVDSEIYRDLPIWLYRLIRPFLISADRAGKYIGDMAISPDWESQSGRFKSAHGPLPVLPKSRSKADCKSLYQQSCRLCNIQGLG